MTGRTPRSDGPAARLAAVFARPWSVPAGSRWLIAGVAGVAFLASGYLFGRLSNGDSSEIELRQLRRRLEVLQSENREAGEQLARLQTNQRVDREAYARVEEQLAELQAKIIEQQEELAFYRGIVGGPGQGGIRVQDFAVEAGTGTALRMRFALAQPQRAEKEVRGQLQVRLEGSRGGQRTSLDLATIVSPARKAALSFAFRYFQDVVVDIELPGDFVPERVVIRILPTTRGVQASVESFPWNVRRS